jgi:hypothetical protein
MNTTATPTGPSTPAMYAKARRLLGKFGFKVETVRASANQNNVFAAVVVPNIDNVHTVNAHTMLTGPSFPLVCTEIRRGDTETRYMIAFPL